MLTRILSFTLAAAWVAAATPAHAYDPSDPGGPSPDDPSAWAPIGEHDAAPVAQGAEPSARFVHSHSSSRAERGPDCGCGAALSNDVAPLQPKEEVMSSLIVSSLMATALAAVPPWFGSEPYVFGFDEIPATAQTQVAPQATTLATSLGSEPFLAAPENAPSARGVSTVAPQSAQPTLATSLGSEPFILGDSGAFAPASPPREAGAGGKLARNGAQK